MDTDGKDPAGAHIYRECEGSAQAGDSPEEEQRKQAVQARNRERRRESVVWQGSDCGDTAQRQSEARAGVESEKALVTRVSGDGLAHEMEDGALLWLAQQVSVQQMGEAVA